MRINIANETDIERVSRRDHLDYVSTDINLEICGDKWNAADAFMTVNQFVVDSRGRQVGLHFGEIRLPVADDGTVSVYAARRAVERLIALNASRAKRRAA